MKVYTVTVTQERDRHWAGCCRVQLVGAGHVFSDGNGSGPDPAEAAHDAMIAAELGLPEAVRDLGGDPA
jgi:hypothetical protein